MSVTAEQLHEYIDYTLLKPQASKENILQLCELARQHAFQAVCVPPYYVPVAVQALQDSEVKVCSVVAFPLGFLTPQQKIAELEHVIDLGAKEVDMVMNLAAFSSGDIATIEEELHRASEVCEQENVLLKVIIESGMWSASQLKQLCDLCAEAQVDFVKTSTGFYQVGAELEKVRMMRQWLPRAIRIKAAGGIRSVEQALQFIEAGASRIGTSSLLVP